MQLTARFSLRGLLLASMSLVVIGCSAGDAFAQQPLPWPDANPVMRFNSHPSRAHKVRPRRKVHHHGARARQALEHAANPTVLRAVAPESTAAAEAPSAVPLPTPRLTSAPDTDSATRDTAPSKSAATKMASPESPAVAGSSNHAGMTEEKAPAKTAAPSSDEQAPKLESPKPSGLLQSQADLSDLPDPAEVPLPETPPSARDNSFEKGPPAATASDAGKSNASRKSGAKNPGNALELKSTAAGVGSAPAPKSEDKAEDKADAAIARSGLDVGPQKDAAPQKVGGMQEAEKLKPEMKGGKAGDTVQMPTNVAPSSAQPPEASPVIRDPGAAEALPIADIPLPEQRPKAPMAGGAAPSSPDEAEGPAKTETPNSTDKLKSNVPDITPSAMVAAAAAIESAKSCEAELKQRGVDFTVGESIAEGECGVLRPVELKTLSSGVSITPTTYLLCRTALALDQWMANGVVPAAKTTFPNDTVKAFEHTSTYVCRKRASEGGISEHARGSAIDIGGFAFKSGRHIEIGFQKDSSPEERFQRAIREAACGPFKTVLGPGTDSDHAAHFHLDMAARRNGGTYCR